MSQWLARRDELADTLVLYTFRDPIARETAVQGLTRRLNQLRHLLVKVFEVLPPEANNPDSEAIADATAFLQAFIFGVYGAVDNLARIWVYETGIRLNDGREISVKRIGLAPANKDVRASLPVKLRAYLGGKDKWFKYLENYRHALAHRIPLYIVPRILNGEESDEFLRLDKEKLEAFRDRDHLRFEKISDRQDALGTFAPMMMHSFEKKCTANAIS